MNRKSDVARHSRCRTPPSHHQWLQPNSRSTSSVSCTAATSEDFGPFTERSLFLGKSGTRPNIRRGPNTSTSVTRAPIGNSAYLLPNVALTPRRSRVFTSRIRSRRPASDTLTRMIALMLSLSPPRRAISGYLFAMAAPRTPEFAIARGVEHTLKLVVCSGLPRADRPFLSNQDTSRAGLGDGQALIDQRNPPCPMFFFGRRDREGQAALSGLH